MTQRIAIATADRATVADHLTHAAVFLVFDVADGAIAARSERTRDAGCGEHKTFVQMLEGCNAVICGGIGQGAYDSLKASGIEPVITVGTPAVEETISQYLAGSLATTNERVCLCHH